MRSLSAKGCTKSWKAHEHNQQFRENQSIDIGKSQRLRQEGNVRINKVSAKRPGLAKITEKERSSRHFESPDCDLHAAANACWIDCADTWLWKWVNSLTTCQFMNCSTTYCGCRYMVEFHIQVAWASLPVTRIHPWLAPESKMQYLLGTVHNTEWMDHCQVCPGSFKAISILDSLNVETPYSYLA